MVTLTKSWAGDIHLTRTPRARHNQVNSMAADPHALNAGFETFKQGFTEAGLAVVPLNLEKQVARHESYKDLIMAQLPGDSTYWAPEIRQQRLKMTLVPYILGIIDELQKVMSQELKLRVENPDDAWTENKAEEFAQTKAGTLLLALLGNFNRSPSGT